MRSLIAAAVALSATISAANAASVTVNPNPGTVVGISDNTGYNSALTASIGALNESITFFYQSTFAPDPVVVGDGTAHVSVTTDLDDTINELVTFTNNVGDDGEFTTYKVVVGVNNAPNVDPTVENQFGSLTVKSYLDDGNPGGFNFSTTPLLEDSAVLWFSLVKGITFDIEATGVTAAGRQFSVDVTAVPIPAAGVLFGSALLGAAALRRRKLQQKLGLPQ
jgi:hypothetical protein